MSTDVERFSEELAKSPSFDGYSLWRMQKDTNDQIFVLNRSRSPVPIELVKLRAVIARARELRRQRVGLSNSAAGGVAQGAFIFLADKALDEFDFVAHYRALGGLRVAIVMGRAVEIRDWGEDTAEATDFWIAGWTPLDRGQRSAVAQALLLRGRY